MSTVDNGPSPNPLDRLLGLRITGITPERVDAVMTVGEDHKQAYGIVHGGVHCTIIESVASIGAHHRVRGEHAVVGICNKTNFVRSVRSGTLTASAVPVSDEDGQQTWEASVHDDRGRLVATGVVTLLQLDTVPGQDTSDHRAAAEPSALQDSGNVRDPGS